MNRSKKKFDLSLDDNDDVDEKKWSEIFFPHYLKLEIWD